MTTKQENTTRFCLKNIRRPFIYLLLLSLCVPLEAQDYTYTTNNATVTITKYNGAGGAVIIPSTINGYPVTTIGEGAFYENASLTAITIPNSITSIGGLAFYWCGALTNLDIPNSVTSIGVQTFGLCSSLTSVIIPNSVASIGVYCFAECTSLTNITIPDSLLSIGNAAFAYDPSLITITVDPLNPAYTNVDGVLFDIAQSTLIQYPANEPGTSYTVPNSVTTIGNFAFQYCNFLTNVMILAGVTNIGSRAFAYDNSLVSITVDELNASYSSSEGVLFDKAQASLIQCPQMKAGNYSIPNTVTSVWDGAFYGCSALANVVLPDSINSLGIQVFQSCSNLTSITIPSGVSNIRSYCFQYCTGLTNLTIPSGVTNIGAYAFNDCNLRTVTFPSSVTYIGSGAFFGTPLKTAYFQGNAPATSGGLFSNQATIYYLYGTKGWTSTFSGLRTFLWDPLSQLAYTINSGTVTIEGYTGPGGAVVIPSTINGFPVTTIDNAAFYYFAGLTSITIPGSVTSIGSIAFKGCSGLTSIYFNGNAPLVGPNVFNGATNATIYYMPGSTGWNSPFAGRPAVLWNPGIPTTPNLGVGANGFGFNITGTASIPIVLEASTSLLGTGWTTLETCTLTNGSIYFSDPQWTNYPSRFYRVRSQ